MHLVFCSLQNQNSFFKILLNYKHVVYMIILITMV